MIDDAYRVELTNVTTVNNGPDDRPVEGVRVFIEACSDDTPADSIVICEEYRRTVAPPMVCRTIIAADSLQEAISAVTCNAQREREKHS